MENKNLPEETRELTEEILETPETEVIVEPEAAAESEAAAEPEAAAETEAVAEAESAVESDGAETEKNPADSIPDNILDEEGNLDMDAAMGLTLEDVETLLTEEKPVDALPDNAYLPEITDADLDLDFPEPEYDVAFRETETDEDFDGMFRTPSQSVVIEDPKPRQPRKGRPKRKKGYGFFGIPHLIATGIWLLIIVSIGVSLGRMLWLCAADVLAFGREDKSVTITIGANDTIEDIAEILHKNQLIRYPGVFKLYASLAVDDGEIAPGTFTLNTLYDYHAIVNGMSAYSSFREVVEDVLIPEGYNCRQIFELLQEKGICTVEALEEYAANGEFQDFWFLEGIARGDKYCLEGYLFPDTYDFYANSTPREALGKMLLGFESRIDREETEAQLAVLNSRLSDMMRSNGCSQAFIDENQIGVKELLIVASLIEEETSSAGESKNIASVIYNRLTQDHAYERYLGIDATILYALGYHTDELTAEDLQIDSPYNTRIYAGLVPTPITNPGLSSIQAALDPADTNYYYYLLNPATGTHTFSKTAAEHDALKVKYGY